jgi:hypothetical protein
MIQVRVGRSYFSDLPYNILRCIGLIDLINLIGINSLAVTGIVPRRHSAAATMIIVDKN